MRGGETQKEPGSRVRGSVQDGLPGHLPGQGDPPQELAQKSNTYCWTPFCFTLGGAEGGGGGVGKWDGGRGDYHSRPLVNGKCLARAYLGI